MSGDADKILTEWQEKLEALLQAEVIVAPGEEKFRLEKQIAVARQKIEARKSELSAAGKLRSSIPNNLPRLQPFFGREKELAVIREALDPDNRNWGALIDGPGGMGKTSLAVRAAYDCPPEQFERILFVSLKDREMGPDGLLPVGNFLIRGLLELLNELARQLGRADIQKSPEDRRMLLLHETLGGTKSLLILDNLESLSKDDCRHILTFVKRLPLGCKAILTSRRRIGSGSELLSLEKLDQDAALETLADLALHIPLLAKTSERERIALYTQTGGKPLLLRWIAGQLGQGSCRTFTDALTFLGSCPPENDLLEFIFGDLANEFTSDEEKALVALSYFTLPAKVKHISTVASLNELATNIALRSLANRSLVTSNDEENEYTLVPMVAEFLRKHRPEIVAATGNRLEQHAYVLILKNGYQRNERFPVLEDAWPTVAPAIPLFVDNPNAQLQEVCDALDRFLDFTGRWDELISLQQQAETKAIAAGQHDRAGWRAYQAGWVHFLRKQAEEVLACAERAESHWKTAGGGVRERATVLRLRGSGLQSKKDYPAAIAVFREALELCLSLGAESDDVASSFNDLGETERLSADYAAAERDYSEALRVARAIGDEEGVAIYSGNLAELALDREEWMCAEKLAREAMPLRERLGRQELIAGNSYRLAKALVRQGKATEALKYACRAVNILKRLRSPDLTSAEEILEECASALGESAIDI
ncbi:MAG TPA: tetratricopeptide repeat protein [Verrucomicrobiales bacterium]|nr:tetratricopeptide repeat protein [Verrucomicrobiales bacterium]